MVIKGEEILAAVEVVMDDLKHQIGVLFDALTDVGIVVRFQLFDDVINHIGIENSMFFEDAAVGRKLVGGLCARSRKLIEAFQFCLIFALVDIDINIGFVGEFEGFLHFETVTSGDDEACEKEIDIG